MKKLNQTDCHSTETFKSPSRNLIHNTGFAAVVVYLACLNQATAIAGLQQPSQRLSGPSLVRREAARPPEWLQPVRLATRPPIAAIGCSRMRPSQIGSACDWIATLKRKQRLIDVADCLRSTAVAAEASKKSRKRSSIEVYLSRTLILL